MEGERIENLFFDLASESRTGILRILQSQTLKMNEIARKLDITATEASRQIERLSEAKLVKKQPDGTYLITTYANLQMQLISPLEFVFKNKEYFTGHDVRDLPVQFLERIGELSETTLVMDAMKSISLGEELLKAAEEFNWWMSEEKGTEIMRATVGPKSVMGLKCRILSPFPPAKTLNIENRTLRRPPVAMALSEKEALVSFRTTDGRLDYSSFYGKRKSFLEWAKDLYSFYWNTASPKYSENTKL